MDTATTHAFLGLTDPAEGLWTAPRKIKGENVVMSVLDSGMWLGKGKRERQRALRQSRASRPAARAGQAAATS